MNLSFIHSYHFLNIPYGSYRLCDKTFDIVDNNDTKICGLLNIPKNKQLYKVELVPITNPFHNLKIIVKLNYNYLTELIIKKKNIPDKTELIKLLKKYYLKTYEEFTRNKDILYNDITSVKQNNCYFIKKDFIQVNDLIVNIETEEFCILTNENKHLYFIKNIGYQNIFYSYPNSNIINQLKKNNELTLLFKKKNNLIITDKTNKEFLENIQDTIFITKEKELELLIEYDYKFIIIMDSFFQKHYNKLHHITWNSVILLNISQFNLKIFYQSIKAFNKFIFFNNIECYNFEPDHFSLFTVLLNKDVCFKNKVNLDKLINSIVFIKQNPLNYNKKYFSLQNVDKVFIKEINSNIVDEFYSLKENFMYYTLIDYKYLKENKIIENKIYKDDKYINPDCPICLEPINKLNLLYTHCNHCFCEKCIITLFKTNSEKKCPLCRTEIDTLLKIRYNKNTNYTSNKLKYILSLNKGSILIISYFTKSINKLKLILENWYHNNNFVLVNINSIHKLHTLNKKTVFSKVLFLEDKGENYNYYQYFINNFTQINKKNVHILSIKH